MYKTDPMLRGEIAAKIRELVGEMNDLEKELVQEVFEKIGFLEEQYFSNYEDLDFCISAGNAGYTIYYAPQAVIYHKVARDWGGLDNPLYIYYQIRNTKRNFA